MPRTAQLLLLLAPVTALAACAVDGPKSQKEAHAQKMTVLAAIASADPAAAAHPAGDPAPSQQAPHAIAMEPGAATTNAVPGTFEHVARPVLMRKCAPCHEPGGQMYGKLPFDKADVVASHPGGVLKRLQGDDRRIVADWLASNPPPAPAL